jgi:hypothetical protein
MLYLLPREEDLRYAETHACRLDAEKASVELHALRHTLPGRSVLAAQITTP